MVRILPRPLVPLAAVLLWSVPVQAQEQVPDGLSFGRALGFEIGASIDNARAHGEARGETLACRSLDLEELPDARICTPGTLLDRDGPAAADSLVMAVALGRSLLPAYTLHLDGDTVDAIALRLESLPGVARASVEAHMDRLGARGLQGSSSRTTAEGASVRTESIVWMRPGERDFARLECLFIRQHEGCTLLVGRMETPEKLERWLAAWRPEYPDPLRSGSREPG